MQKTMNILSFITFIMYNMYNFYFMWFDVTSSDWKVFYAVSHRTVKKLEWKSVKDIMEKIKQWIKKSSW